MANYFREEAGAGPGAPGRSFHDSPAKSSLAGTTERRTSPRHSFNATAEVHEPKSRAVVSGRCSDLSIGGCYVDCISPLPTDTLATVRLQRESKTFTAQARVMYSKVGMGMGLAFQQIRPEDKIILENWLRELSGEAPLAPESPENEFLAAPAGKPGSPERATLTQLIAMLIQKHVLSDEEGAKLLESLFR